jgi:hypothetical protein
MLPKRSKKRNQNRTNTETTDKAATVAEQSSTGAPDKAPSKKGVSKKKDAPKAKKTLRQPHPRRLPPNPSARLRRHAPRAKARRSWK